MRQLIFVFCWAAVVFAAAGNTTLVLVNGDRLQGAVIREENGIIHFKSELLGEIKLEKKQVKDVISAPQKPETVLSTVPAERKATPPPTGKTVKAAPKPKKNWSGNIGLSVNKQHAEYEQRSGTQFRRQERDTEYFRLSGRMKWEKEKHHLEWNGSYVYSQVDDKKNNDLYNCSQRYRCDLNEEWFGQSETSYERNYLRILSKEIQQSAGIGWRPVKKPLLTVDLVPGVNYYYRDQAEERTKGVTPAFQENLTSKLTENLSLFQGFSYTGSPEEYYYKINAGLNNRLIKNLSLRLEYRYEVDANVDEDTDPFIQRQLLSSIQYRF